MAPSQTKGVSVTMQNTGDTTWETSGSNPYYLASENPEDNTNWGLSRVSIVGSVAPNAEYTFQFTIKAPVGVGLYNFQWRMLQDLVQRFGDSSTNIVVEVEKSFSGLGTTTGQSPEIEPPLLPVVGGSTLLILGLGVVAYLGLRGRKRGIGF